ncbi:MAG: glycosyltransferase family 2 protein [Gemmatimonadota bacterium]
MLQTLALFLLSPVAVAVALPAISDLALWLRGIGRPSWLPQGKPRNVPLLFLIPAHDEELLIERTVRSLCAQEYPAALLKIVVIADNCTDGTAALARTAGATVLERHSETQRGKHHAIEWALGELPWREYEAVVVIDADTVVEPDYSTQLSRWPDLPDRALQTYDHLSNERENSLTRLAGLLTRTRYDIALPLKARAGFSVPMTGDGIVLGREILTRYPWRIETITEGWELYARLTIGGEVIRYEPRARLYAQETRSLNQSRSQRERWTAGRLEVLRLHWQEIVSTRRLPLVQRVDLISELMSMGPIMRGMVAALAGGIAFATGSSPGFVIGALCTTGILQPALYSILVLRHHPDPWQTIRALLFLFPYAGWRAWVAVRTLTGARSGFWTRTKRQAEAAADSLPPNRSSS